MQSLNAIDIILGIFAAAGTGGSVLFAKKGLFFLKALRQSIVTLEEAREANNKIYDRVKADPKRKELTMIMEGTVKKIQGLTKINEK